MNNIIDWYATKSEKLAVKKLSHDEKSKEFIARYSAILLKRFQDIEKANVEAETRTEKLKKELGLHDFKET